MNMMYELTGYCTSLVAQDQDGTVYHARNLDFGIFMGTDAVTHSWKLTQLLRDILVNVRFMRGGQELYDATTYAGFVGLLSGSRKGAFSITVDTRYDATLDEGILGWIAGKNSDCQFLTFETRHVIEGNSTYDEALQSITTYKPLGPAYIIIAGTEKAQGAVVALDFNGTAEKRGESWKPYDVWHLSDQLSNNSFYVIETNYDRRAAPPDFDDRRYPAENCLDALGTHGVTLPALWKVMSSNPTRNALTTFTTLMVPKTGHFEAYVQNCAPGPQCAPF